MPTPPPEVRLMYDQFMTQPDDHAITVKEATDVVSVDDFKAYEHTQCNNLRTSLTTD